MAGRLRAGLAVLTLLLAAGCRLEISVGIDVEEDGSGQVRAVAALDAEAARRFPDLADQLRVDDLTESGWTVTGPTVEGDGRTYVRLTHPFRSPEEAADVLSQLSGDTGPFRDLRIERDPSFASTRFGFAGTVDLRAGPEGFGDETLRQQLGGSSLGLAPDELESRTGAPLAEVFTFRVLASLPGGVESTNAPGTVDGTAIWRPVLGERIEMQATSRSWHLARIVWTGVAVLAGAAALAAAAARIVRRRG